MEIISRNWNVSNNGNKNYFGEFGFGKKVDVDTYIIIKYNSLFYNEKFNSYCEICLEGKYSYNGI